MTPRLIKSYWYSSNKVPKVTEFSFKPLNHTLQNRTFLMGSKAEKQWFILTDAQIPVVIWGPIKGCGEFSGSTFLM